MVGLTGFDEYEQCRDLILTNILFAPEQHALTSGQELELINTIKTTFLNILCAFSPDLPAQYASQFESHACTMTENNDYLWDRNDFFGFLNIYKIELLSLLGMLDKGPDTGSFYKVDEHQDDLDPVRSKITNYSRLIDRIYELIQADHIDNLNLDSLHSIGQMYLKDAHIPVEWLKKASGPTRID